MRGTPWVVGAAHAPDGIIPACAGNTRQQGCHVALSRDHPRMCGEHVSVLITIKSETGSSPHVRGTLPIYRLIECSRGIIPACAGNTRSASSPEVSTRDHPRMCGEHCASALPLSDGLGSSPHVRGTHFGRRRGAPHHGIIPACAGNTFGGVGHALASRDHPRMCGEHLCLLSFDGLGEGSSPHVRGTRGVRRAAARMRGIIPACAGNTLRK